MTSFTEKTIRSFDFLPQNFSEPYAHLPESLKPFFILWIFQNQSDSLIIPYKDTPSMMKHKNFFDQENIPNFTIPFYDLLFYEEEAMTFSILQKRMQSFYAITKKTKAIYLLPLNSFLFPTMPLKTFQNEFSCTLKEGQTIKRESLIDKLVYFGYNRLPKIEWQGSFSLRGEILDIFSPQHPNPIRISFFDDTIEKIRFFSSDPSSKESFEPLSEISFLSIHDFIFSENKKQEFLQFLKKEFAPEKITRFAEEDHAFNIHLAPFFYQQNSLLDFFIESEHPFKLFLDDVQNLSNKEKSLKRDLKELYFNTFNNTKIMIHPNQYLLSLEKMLEKTDSSIKIEPFLGNHDLTVDLSLFFKETPQYKGQLSLLSTKISSEWESYTLYFVVSEIEENEQIKNIFPQHKIISYPYLEYGFVDVTKKEVFLTMKDIFGKETKKLKNEKTFLKNSSVIENFSDILKGDFVVHLQHGIGIYEGIEKISILGKQKDYIKITYAEESVLYIPLEQITFIHKYLGGTTPPLSHLGGKKWDQKKERVAKKMEGMAEELALLYQTRQQIKGISFPKDTSFQKAFEDYFPFTPTEGQILAIKEMKADMESPFAMDRLICGDVGYGKTEVALRGVFKAICGGKQVILLAPTTLLAQQHYHNALKRFEHFAVNIKMLSRLITPAEQKKVKQGLKDGNIDFVIGTSSLLSPSIEFKDLGLLIIDEEQRFGVQHKERIKQMRKNLDVLTLSATPIPRTLYMGLSEVRPMSLITTPPEKRLPIKTYVAPFKEDTLEHAISREIERNGQIFIIHNRVKTIDIFSTFIQRIFPSLRIAVGHAKMSNQEMESIFVKFMNHEYDILISTTIVENGIDIPNANTIIIDRPELLGLAEIYQLRGRVGRGLRQGYAYLFYNASEILTDKVKRRLETIEENTELGSGFQVAMRDLEIRGAGNLLGKDQSGLFDDVGIELYTKILKQAMKKVKGILEEEIPDPLLDLPFNGYIPENYIHSENDRFTLYKSLMRATEISEVEDMDKYLKQEYGKIPPTLESLFLVAKIKVMCKKLKIKELKYEKEAYYFYFQLKPDVNIRFLSQLMQEDKARVVNSTTFLVKEKSHPSLDFLEEIAFILENLSHKNA